MENHVPVPACYSVYYEPSDQQCTICQVSQYCAASMATPWTPTAAKQLIVEVVKGHTIAKKPFEDKNMIASDNLPPSEPATLTVPSQPPVPQAPPMPPAPQPSQPPVPQAPPMPSAPQPFSPHIPTQSYSPPMPPAPPTPPVPVQQAQVPQAPPAPPTPPVPVQQAQVPQAPPAPQPSQAPPVPQAPPMPPVPVQQAQVPQAPPAPPMPVAPTPPVPTSATPPPPPINPNPPANIVPEQPQQRYYITADHINGLIPGIVQTLNEGYKALVEIVDNKLQVVKIAASARIMEGSAFPSTPATKQPKAGRPAKPERQKSTEEMEFDQRLRKGDLKDDTALYAMAQNMGITWTQVQDPKINRMRCVMGIKKSQGWL